MASCGSLKPPVPPCAAGLDPLNIKISDSGGLDLETWCLDAGCWKDWNGLGQATEVTAFWGEGIGRNSHTLELQELGGFHGVQSDKAASSSVVSDESNLKIDVLKNAESSAAEQSLSRFVVD